MPSRRMRILRAPNCERAPKPRTDTRVSCDGFVRFATVTPGSSDNVCSTNVWRLSRQQTVGRVLLIAYGKSSGDRPTVARHGDDRGQLAGQRILSSGRDGERRVRLRQGRDFGVTQARSAFSGSVFPVNLHRGTPGLQNARHARQHLITGLVPHARRARPIVPPEIACCAFRLL
jgi:hypothetical protein